MGIAEIVSPDWTRYVWENEVGRYRVASHDVIYTYRRKSAERCTVER